MSPKKSEYLATVEPFGGMATDRSQVPSNWAVEPRWKPLEIGSAAVKDTGRQATNIMWFPLLASDVSDCRSWENLHQFSSPQNRYMRELFVMFLTVTIDGRFSHLFAHFN